MTVPFFLPYYEQPHWDIPFPIVGELTIHAFGVLVAMALVVGTWVSRWQGVSRGQNPTHVVDAVTWTCISGFVIAHIVSVVLYFPERVVEDPLQLLYIWNGLSSFGGFLGGVIGAFVFLRSRGLPILSYIDSISVGTVAGWVFGRLGCTVAHDHPGLSTDFALAFDHPQRGPIHDLGFYEFLFTLVLLAVIMVVRRFNWPPGAIPGLIAIMYSPVRFAMDFLRIQDAKYFGLTPGQWSAVLLLVLGVGLMRFAFTRGRSMSWTTVSSAKDKKKSGDVEKVDDDGDSEEPEDDDDAEKDSRSDEKRKSSKDKKKASKK